MEEKQTGCKVAVLNSNEEVVNLFKDFLAEAQFAVVAMKVGPLTAWKVEEIKEFLQRENPSLVLWDISPPYKENWEVYQEIINSPAAEERRFVATTVERTHLEDEVGPVPVIEFRGKIEDMDRITQLAKEGVAVQCEREK